MVPEGLWGAGTKHLCHCRDGLPYCEADYHTKFGVRCDGCGKFITGHVLEVSPIPPDPGVRQGLGLTTVREHYPVSTTVSRKPSWMLFAAPYRTIVWVLPS